MCQGLFQIPRGWERNNQEVEHDFIIIKSLASEIPHKTKAVPVASA